MSFEKTFEIRDYNSSDYNGLLRLWELTDLGSVARGDDQLVIDKTLRQGGKLLIMRRVKDSLIAGSSWMTTDGRRAYLHHFGIHPDLQGKGLSKPLLKASMEFINKLGQQVKLEVHKSNAKAIHLYKKYGFKYLGDYLVYIIRDISKS